MPKFIIQTTDISLITSVSNVTHLFADFYSVEASDEALLSSQVVTCESAESLIQLQTLIPFTNEVVGLPTGADWPRRRAISRSHPLEATFVKVDHTYYQMPELFIMDSGINFTHAEFAGLATSDFYKIPKFASFRDQSGHGTAIAAAAVGVNLGMTSNVVLRNVKVLDESSTATLLELGAAFNAILMHHNTNPLVTKVVNCSWSLPKSAYIEGIITTLLSAGIVVVAAAGNSGADVATLTPASMVDVITVGASDADDVVAGFNNFATIDMPITTNNGLTLDIFAPGVDVVVAKFNADGSYCTTSGTSISSAFVSGAVVDAAGIINNLNGANARQVIINLASKGIMLMDYSRFATTQNNLLYLASAAGFITNKSCFAGIISTDVPTFTLATKSLIAAGAFSLASGEQPIISLEFISAEEASINSNASVNSGGDVKIPFPTVNWLTNEDFRLFSFKVNAEFQHVIVSTPTIMFAVKNPTNNADIIDSLTEALENLNANVPITSLLGLSNQVK